MSRGGTVRVWPEGQPERAAVGYIVIISPNELSAIVQFSERPPFLAGRGFAVDPSTGHVVMVLARNVSTEPWHQLHEPDGGRYEVGPQ
jgi:hypothetical protein